MRHLARAIMLLTALVTCITPGLCQAGEQTQRAGPVGPVNYNAEAWAEFSSPEGHFSVSLPGTPRKEIEQADSPIGKIDMHSFTLRNSNQSPQYDVMFFDIPASLLEKSEAPIKKIFDNVRDEGVRAVGGKLLEERESGVGELAGRFYKVQTSDGNILRIRAVLVKNRFYNLLFTTESKNEPEAVARLHDEAAARFLNSFRLLSEQELASFEGEVDRLLKDGKVGIVIGRGSSPPPDEAAKTPARILYGGVLEGKVVAKPKPIYPAIARAARAQGPVTVKVIVDEEGKVIAAQAESGHPLLQQAAVKAAREARFSPTYLEGKPVKLLGTIFYNFRLP